MHDGSSAFFTSDSISLALSVAPVAMLLVDPTGVIRFANPEIHDLFGYPEPSMIGLPIEELVPPEVRAGHRSLRDAFAVLPAKRKMGADRGVFGFTASGEAIPLELALEPVDVEGTCMTIVTAIDARTREANKQRIRAIMDAASCAMVVIDEAGDIEFVNLAVGPLLGYSIEELLGQSVEILVPEDLRRAHQVYRRSYVSHANPRQMGGQRTLFARHKNGQKIAVGGVLNRIDIGGQQRVVVTLIDLTERIAAERILEARALELERLNADLSQFNRSVSHDLKAPLSSIAGLLELSLEDMETGETEDLKDNIRRALDIAHRSVSDIEELLRVALVPDRALVPERVDISALASQLWEDLSADQSDIRLELDLRHQDPVMLEETALRSILRNLFSNAMKFRDLGKGSLVGQLSSRTEDGDLVMGFRDNGIGIAEDFLPNIFGLFQRGGEKSGSGVGLNLVQRNVERLGGSITVASKPGEGTVFTLRIPARKDT